MALAETANLIVNLGLKGNFARDISKANKSLDGLVRGESRAFKAGAQIGTGIRNAGRLTAIGIGFIAGNVALGLDSLVKLEEQTAQTNAAIKSTGGIAGVTAGEVRKLAESYESLNATIGDETIQQAENLLLTFTNIRKDAFEPTLRAILDMNARLGGGPEGLAGIAQLVGRALDNPEKSLGLLERRVGKFTDAERAQIKEAVRTNNLFDAQRIILDKLDKKYGGSFLAQGGTTGAKVAKFRDAIEDLQRTLAAGLLPVVSNVADALSTLLADPKVQADVEQFGKGLAGLFSKENIATGARAIGDFFRAARDAAPTVIAAAKAVGGVISTAVKLFQSLPPELQSLAIAGVAVNKLTGGLVTNIAGGLISSVLKQLVSGVVNVQGATVVVNGPVAGGTPGAVGANGKLGTLLAIPIAGAIIAAAVPIGEAFAAALPSELKGQGGLGMSEAQTRITNARLAEIARNTAPVTGSHEASGQRRTETAAAINKTTTAIEKLKAKAVPQLGKISDQAKADAAILKAAQDRTRMETKASITTSAAVTGALIGVGTATTRMSGSLVSSSVRGVAPPIVSAIRASRPIVSTHVTVNVSGTSVKSSVTKSERYGPSGGSSTRDSRYTPQPI